MKPKIIVTRDIPDEVESKLKQYFRVSFNREDKVFSNDILEKAMENADGIVCTVTDNLNQQQEAICYSPISINVSMTSSF